MRPWASMTTIAVHGGFDDRTPARLARAEPLFELHAFGEIVEHAGELWFTADRHFADGKMERERRAVTATARSPRGQSR